MTQVCRHFTVCGGCVSQDVAPDTYRAQKREQVARALAQAGLPDITVADVVQVPLHSRRRAVLKIKSLAEGLHIGFHAARSHTIVDMHQCDILTPGLFALVGQLRHKLEKLLGVGETAELHLTECDNGVDAAFRWSRKLTSGLTTILSEALGDTAIIRLVLGNDTVFETTAPIIRFGGIAVKPPPQAFLQPTKLGEAGLQEKVLALTAKAKNVADLFSGCGTFALPLAAKAKVHAVEQDKTMLAALGEGARQASGLKPVTTEARDLFKRPLTPPELKDFDAVVLDPPRAGAEAQCRALAASRVRRIAYVSCDAAAFARDARILRDAGFIPGAVTPVDQFLFSTHIELVGGFHRP